MKGRIWFLIGPFVCRKNGCSFFSAGFSAWAEGISFWSAGLSCPERVLAGVERLARLRRAPGKSRSVCRRFASWLAKAPKTLDCELTKSRELHVVACEALRDQAEVGDHALQVLAALGERTLIFAMSRVVGSMRRRDG